MRLEANSETALRTTLHVQGHTVLSVSPVVLRWGRPRVGRVDVEEWCTQVARLLRAGMSLPETLEVQALRLGERGDPYLSSLYQELHERLSEGSRLSQSMASTGQFAPMLIAAVQASERSGRVADALEEYARHEGTMRELRRRIVNAAIYPLLVIAFGFLVALFLIGYVVPRFSKVFASSTAKVSSSTGLIVAVGTSINAHPILVVVGLMLVGGLVAVAAADVRVRRWAGDLFAGFGPVRRWLGDLQRTRICQSMAMLISNGFTIPEAMKLATPLAIREDLQKAMRRATDLIETGMATSAAWRETGLAETFAVRVLQAGERTGDLGRCFDSLGQTYRLQVQTKLERTSQLAEPILLIVVASLIGTIVVLMYLPIVDLATTVG
jgi:general secretion pathway protein F